VSAVSTHHDAMIADSRFAGHRMAVCNPRFSGMLCGTAVVCCLLIKQEWLHVMHCS
jgi:hypothetical protein